MKLSRAFGYSQIQVWTSWVKGLLHQIPVFYQNDQHNWFYLLVYNIMKVQRFLKGTSDVKKNIGFLAEF